MALDKAYVAALLDTNGAIVIYHDKTSVLFRLRVDVENTELGILRGVKSVFSGGRIYLRKQTWDTERTEYVLSFANDSAVRMLKALLPFLRVQKKQAELGIKLYGSKKQEVKQHRGVVHV